MKVSKKGLLGLALIFTLGITSLNAAPRGCGCGGSRPTIPAPTPKPTKGSPTKQSKKAPKGRQTSAPRPVRR